MKLFKFNEFLNESINNWIKAYHGTPNGNFDKFSMDMRATGADIHGMGDYGKGFYFTPNKDEAIAYAKGIPTKRKDTKNEPYLYTVELKMNKPFDMRIYSNYNNELNKLVKKYGVFNIPDEESEKLLNSLNLTEEDLEFYYDVESSIGDNWGDWDIESKLKEKGYDSLINPDGSEYIVYNPDNIRIIKSEPI